MMRQSARVHESLSRLQEVVLTQQAALAERAKEQQHKAAMELDAEHQAAMDDSKNGGFAGADPKKRRGVSNFDPYYLNISNLLTESCCSRTLPFMQQSRNP